MLLHSDPQEAKEVQEHQLAPVNKQERKGFSQKDKPKTNTQDQNRNPNSTYPRGQNSYRQPRGHNNPRGGSFRGRPFATPDNRYNNRGQGYSGRGWGYDTGYNTYNNNYNRGRSRPFQRRPWRSRSYQPRGRGYAQQAGTGDLEYRGIPQYKYVCGVCRNRGHYDHQCHTLQHLAHAIQTQQAQNYNGANTNPENDNGNDQPAF